LEFKLRRYMVCLDAPAGRVEQCMNGHLLCAEVGDSCLAKLRAHAVRPNRSCAQPSTFRPNVSTLGGCFSDKTAQVEVRSGGV
jgi:hypothetical protein